MASRKNKSAKGWSAERRAAQAERCRQNAPWKHATGPKTSRGKARSCLNAYKHGGFARYKALVDEVCAHNHAVIAALRELHEIELIKDQQKQSAILSRCENPEKRTEGMPE